ncbi:MAG: RcpC/CpaB family pilus assembly protein [Bacilli bacterium]
MNNIIIGLKKFFTNKNTVTIVGILIAIVVLYIGYNMRIKAAVETYPMPYALKEINPRTEITADMIGTVDAPVSMFQGAPIADARSLIGKYSNYDTVIPKGSLFYKRSVVTKEQLPDSILRDYPDGYVLVNMPLDMNTSYGNLILPGNYVDIYLKAVNKLDENNSNKQDKIMVGKLLENVKILSVLDGSGQPVFENIEEKRTPAMMIFAVPEEYHILLRKTMYLRTYDANLLPVPTKESLKEQPGEVRISSDELKNWVNKVTYWSEDMSTSNTVK